MASLCSSWIRGGSNSCGPSALACHVWSMAHSMQRAALPRLGLRQGPPQTVQRAAGLGRAVNQGGRQRPQWPCRQREQRSWPVRRARGMPQQAQRGGVIRGLSS